MLQRIMLLGLLCGLLTTAVGCCGPCHGNLCSVPICTTENCGSAYSAGCAGPCAPCGPLSAVLSLFHPLTWCGSSCGECYLGDFHGDPPECCDPCDRCGNFVGAGAGGCNSGHCGGGYPAGYGGGGGGHCANCGLASSGPNAYGPQAAPRAATKPESMPRVTRTYRSTRR